jgi:ketosteroid isomerase-like protein
VAQFKAKDLKGFMSMYADDYKGKGMDGKPTDKKATEAEMKQAMANTKTVKSSRYSIDKLTVKGNTATIEGTMALDMDVVDPDGQMGPKGATHRMHMVMKTRDVDVKSGGAWKTKSSEPLPGSMTMVDGKQFPPPHPAPRRGPPGKK